MTTWRIVDKVGLKGLTPRPLDGSRRFRGTGLREPPLLEDYWRWSASPLLDNVGRGVLAEFIVATALSAHLDDVGPRVEWDDYDLKLNVDGRRVTVEVKSSARVQSWRQDDFSALSFRVKATRKWDPEAPKGQRWKPPERADVYVFCALTATEIESHLDALDLHNWEFRVVEGRLLGDKESIAWSTVADLCDVVTCGYADLEEQVIATVRKLV